MPAKSPEALAKKARTRQSRRWRARKPMVITKSMMPIYKISARRMMPKLPPMTKSELRAMLASAAENTK